MLLKMLSTILADYSKYFLKVKIHFFLELSLDRVVEEAIESRPHTTALVSE